MPGLTSSCTLRLRRGMLIVFFCLLLIICGVSVLRPDIPWRIGERIRRVGAGALLVPYAPEETVQYSADALAALPAAGAPMLVNADYPIADDISGGDMADYAGSGWLVHPLLGADYAALCAAVEEAAGERLLIRDAFRSRAEQEARYAADPVLAAIPGTGEHETGLALDVCVTGYGGMSFLKTRAGRYVNNTAWKHGFIIRYPIDGEAVTGKPFEPWHLRWVGAPHAEIIHRSAMTLEEYLERLGEGWFSFGGTLLLTRQPMADVYSVPEGAKPIAASPDNTGCVVIVCRSGAER